MRLILLLLLLVSNGAVFSQDTTLTYERYIEQVLQHHPAVYQATIVSETGDATVQSARGQFDPKLFGNANQKYFKGSQYYSNINGGVKIPTWFGISAEAGYQQNDGVYLNPENRTPEAGLWYAGLRLELGNGLIMDKRRAEFQKAKLFRDGTALQQKMLMNELTKNATLAYWKWNSSYQKVKVYQAALENAELRFEGIKGSAEFGDRPYIDTIEAFILVQSRSVSLSKAQLSFDNAELNIEMYLWEQGFIPLELENAIPGDILPTSILPSGFLNDSLIINHPYLQLNALKIDQKEVDLQLKREQLKPNLTLKYNAISEPLNGNPLSQYSTANYTWGATFSYALLSRKERGNVKLAKLKLQDQELELVLTEAELNYMINAAFNNYVQALEQLTLSRQLMENNQILFAAEKSLFDLGESSVFMINSREGKLLKSQVDLIESENNCLMLKSKLDYSLMLLY